MSLRDLMPILRLGEMEPEHRRKSGRFHTHGLRCTHGKISDVSSDGARIASRKKWREGEEKLVSISGSHLSVTVTARCIWVRKDGFMRWIAGVEFVDRSSEQSAAIRELARAYAWGPEKDGAFGMGNVLKGDGVPTLNDVKVKRGDPGITKASSKPKNASEDAPDEKAA